MNNRISYEKHFIEELNKKIPTLIYISGYSGCESKVLLQCRLCGKLLHRTASLIRGNHPKRFICEGCIDKEKRDKELINMISKYINELIRIYNKEHRKQINNIYSSFKHNTTYINICKCCSNEIYTNNRYKLICDSCRGKNKYKKHSNKSLKLLYKRDKGICHICNKKCDYEDYIYKGDTFIAGNYYPSVDHVIPINKGGTDNWDNLKLAHRICNTLKSDD